MSLVRVLAPLCLVALIASGCVSWTPAPDVVTPPPGEVVAVRISPMDDPSAPPALVEEPERTARIAGSFAFSGTGWIASEGRELRPHYRIEMLGDAGVLATYWLGANSDPPGFPCYSLCTGWWTAPSGPDGQLDPSRYKGLADTVSFPLFGDLQLPGDG